MPCELLGGVRAVEATVDMAAAAMMDFQGPDTQIHVAAQVRRMRWGHPIVFGWKRACWIRAFESGFAVGAGQWWLVLVIGRYEAPRDTSVRVVLFRPR